MVLRARMYDDIIDDSKGNVLINCLNATSMRNQAQLVAKLLKRLGYSPKFANSISVADVGINDNVGFLWMQLFSFEFLGSEIPAYLATDKPRAMYVTIEGIPSKANVLYSNLPRVRYIAVSDFVAKMLHKVGVRVRARVHHGIDFEAVMKARQLAPKIRQYLDANLGESCKIVYVGRDDPRKGLSKLAEANRMLLDRGITTYHLIMKTEASAKAKFPEENVVFVEGFGSSSYVETLALMAACDYLVMPSLCVPPDAMVATINGFKRICEIKEGEYVLTHRGRFRRVTKVLKRKYRGKMVCIKPQKLNRWIKFTPEHPILVRKKTPHWGKPSRWSKYKPMEDFEWVAAKDLTTDYVVCVPKVKDSKVAIDVLSYLDDVIEKDGLVYGVGRNQFGKEFIHPQSRPLPRVINPSDEFLELLGYYLAEGCATPDGIYYAFSQLEQKKIERLKELGEHFNARVTVRTMERNRAIQRFYHKLLGQLFEALCGKGAKNKRLPLFLLQLPKEKLAILLHAMVAGDGYVGEWMDVRYSTISESLALSTYLLAAKIGYLPSFSDQSKTNHGYVVSFTPMRTVNYAREDNRYVYLPIKEIRFEEYDGYVYNLEVEEDNSYVVEGIAVHNCEGFGLPVLEANAVGKPAIHTWCPPFVEFSSKEFNFVYEFDGVELHQNAYRQFWVMHDYKPDYLAESIEMALDIYYNDKDSYEEYCILAAEHAKDWDYRVVYSDLIELMGLEVDRELLGLADEEVSADADRA